MVFSVNLGVYVKNYAKIKKKRKLFNNKTF